MNNTEESGVNVPECVPIRILNEFTYCPRLAFIEWVQSEFKDNFETEDGSFKHRVVDKEGGALPTTPNDDQEYKSRSVWLSAPVERLTGRMDLIEGVGSSVTVIDYKRGSVPDNPERSWETDRIQLCAQGLVLRENGYRCDKGFAYYIASKSRIAVEFTDDLFEYTRKQLHDLIQLAESAEIPSPLKDSPKCVRCSIAPICLPDETTFLAEGDKAGRKKEELRRILPASDNSAALYVQEQGARIGKRGECFEIKTKDAESSQAKIFETSQICVFGNVQITTQALQEMCMRNIPVTLFSVGGWFYGMVHGMSHKNVELRCRQYRAAANPSKCLAFAGEMVATKIKNCRTLLMRNSSEVPESTITALQRLALRAKDCTTAESLLGIEGAAARAYFSQFSGMIKARQDNGSQRHWGFDFDRRNRRPPTDPVNAMLSYAYAMLAKDFSIATLAVGFDPFLGFYHQPRYGRPALALDLMEEFRPIIADSVVLTVINNGVLEPDDFLKIGVSAAMKPNARKKFIQAYERRMDSLVTHPLFGYRVSYRRVLEIQARLVNRVLMEEIPEYPGFRTR